MGIGRDAAFEPSAERTPGAPTAKRGFIAGLIAGTVGLGCCVGPATAALLGLSSGAYAVDLATNLYARWGWAFKLAGAVLAGAAVFSARRKAAACSIQKPRLGRFAAIVGLTGLVTYGLLYGVTTLLGAIPDGV